jgi:hypothetical protein
MVDREKVKVPCASKGAPDYTKIKAQAPRITLGARYPNNSDTLTMNVRSNFPGPNAYDSADLPNLRLSAPPKFSMGKDRRDRSIHEAE